MRSLNLFVVFLTCVLLFIVNAQAEDLKGLMIDDFESIITGGPDGTVDFGAGNDSSVNVTAATDIKQSGNQSIKVEYDAVPGGYMWIARGFGLDVKGAACWMKRPEEINWKDYNALSFYMFGANSKANVAFDIKDNGGEIFRFLVEDNFTGWKQIVCPFAQFFSRTDWQPNNADKNDAIDFPIKSFQFEPLPQAKGILYFDDVELVKSK
jgi:hypothetical protein